MINLFKGENITSKIQKEKNIANLIQVNSELSNSPEFFNKLISVLSLEEKDTLQKLLELNKEFLKTSCE